MRKSPQETMKNLRSFNVENDAQILETLAVNEEESTSSEIHEKTNDEVVKTIPEMTFWVLMHEEVKNKKETPTSEVDEYIIHLNNELRGIIVKKKNEKKWKIEKKINDLGRLCAQVAD